MKRNFLILLMLAILSGCHKPTQVVDEYVALFNEYCSSRYDDELIKDKMDMFEIENDKTNLMMICKVSDEITIQYAQLNGMYGIDITDPSTYTDKVSYKNYFECIRHLGISKAEIIELHVGVKEVSGIVVTATIRYTGGVLDSLTTVSNFVINGRGISAIYWNQNETDNLRRNEYQKLPYAVFKDGTLTLYYDSNKPHDAYSIRQSSESGWYPVCDQIRTVVFDKSFKNYKPLSCFCWFYRCEKLVNIIGMKENLNTSKVTTMAAMFGECKNLTSIDVSGFNTANVTNMLGMFYRCNSLKSLDVSGFNTANVTNMLGMFRGCNSLKSLDVSGFNTAKVTDMQGLFCECNSLKSLDVSGFNTAKVTDMQSMFYRCNSLKSLDVSGFNTANVTNMEYMFGGCNSLTSLDVSGFNTAKVTDMRAMFFECKNLASLDVSGFNTANVTNMRGMFCRCNSLRSLDVSGFNTANVTNMQIMFYECKNLTSLDVSGFNTAKVTDMLAMFGECKNLTSIDVSGFNTANVTNMLGMFLGCENLATIYIGPQWNTSMVNSHKSMFLGCNSLVGGSGTKYQYPKDDLTYAKIDGGESSPGYFTRK